jgi:ABC-type sugar transport system substrate-binding protein
MGASRFVRSVATVRAALAASALLAAASCGDDSAAKVPTASASGAGTGARPAKKWTIGATIDRLNNDYFAKIAEGLKTRAAELGVELQTRDAQGSDTTQLQQLEILIRQKVDAIVIAPVNDDVPQIEETVARAKAAGIKVVAQSQRCKTADVYVSIRQHDYGECGGRMAGEWIRDHRGGEAEVAVLSMPERPTIHERVQGIRDGLLAVAPKAKFVQEISSPSDEKAQSNTEAALQSTPTLRVIVSYNDVSALAAANALVAHFGERAGKKGDEFAVFGLDAIPGAVAALADPASPLRGTVDIDPLRNGKLDVDVAVALLEGRPVPGAEKSADGQLYVPVAMKAVTPKSAGSQ